MASTLENALRLVKPGEMVVSLTDILDKLGDKITADERNQLLIAMLSPRREKVQPGDLVTSDMVNQMLADITDLQVRVLSIENSDISSSQQVIITSPLPGEQFQVGQVINIVGKNFDFSIGAQQVFFDTTPPVGGFKLGSNDNLLIVEVPMISGVTQTGKQVTLNVSNHLNIPVSRQLTVKLPDVPVSGPVDVVIGGVNPDPIVAGQTAEFACSLTSRATMPANFLITATLSGKSWTTQLLASNKTALAQPLNLVPRVPVDILISLTVPGNANLEAFDLIVNAVSGNAQGDSGLHSYTVGQATNEDASISFDNPSAAPPGAYSNGKISLAATSVATISIGIKSTDGQYDLSLQLVPKSGETVVATGWKMGWVDPTPTDAQHSELSSTAISLGSKLSKFAVMPQVGASLTGRIQLKVKRQGASLAKTINFDLILL